MVRTGWSRLLRGATVTFALAVGVIGCGGSSSSSSAEYTNPVYPNDFPDPYVLQDGKTFYAYSTNVGGRGNTPLLESKDLIHWTFKGEAFPVTPRWLSQDLWGPSVARVAAGKYVEFYSGRDQNANDVECIGVATSRSPAGPFADRSAKPELCQTARGGDIDPQLFTDTDGKLYLYFKNDGNCCGSSTFLWAQKVATDGTTLLGSPVKLIFNDQNWEGNVIEAPFMWKRDGRYYLFFSGGDWNGTEYSVGYAACKGPLGPCTAASENPILQYHQGCRAAGPGGETIIRDSKGQDWIIYHAWNGVTGYDSGGVRALWMDPLNWKDGKPVAFYPSCTKEAGPAVS